MIYKYYLQASNLKYSDKTNWITRDTTNENVIYWSCKIQWNKSFVFFFFQCDYEPQSVKLRSVCKFNVDIFFLLWRVNLEIFNQRLILDLMRPRSKMYVIAALLCYCSHMVAWPSYTALLFIIFSWYNIGYSSNQS